MGRFLTNSLSSNSSIPNVYTTLVAGENIQKNDLVSLGLTDNKVYYAVPPGDSSVLAHPMVADGVNISASSMGYIKTVSTGSGVSPGQIRIATLTNGYVVNLKVDDGSYPSVTAYLYTDSGVLSKTIAVGTTIDTEATHITLVALPTGGFALAYVNTSGSLLSHVYDNTGTKVGSTNTLSSGVFAGVCSTALADGSFVIGFYRRAVSSGTPTGVMQPYFARFNSANVPQGSTTIIDSTTGGSSRVRSGESMSICTLVSNGGFVIAYQGMNTTNNPIMFAKYNNSGVLQGSLATLDNGSANEVVVNIGALTGGGFVIAYNTLGVSANQNSWMISSTGALIGSPQTHGPRTGYANGLFGAVRVLPTPDGGYTGFWAFTDTPTGGTGNFIHIHSDDSTGASVKAADFSGYKYPIDTIYVTAEADIFWAATSADGLKAVLFKSTSSSSPIHTYSSSSLDSVKNVLLTQFAQSASGIIAALALVFSGSSASASGLGFNIYTDVSAVSSQGKQFIGVAAATANSGSSVTIQIMGVAQLRLPFPVPTFEDHRNDVIAGQKYSALGTTIILSGTSPVLD